MKTKKVHNGNDNGTPITTLDRRIFDALRAEVTELATVLTRDGPALSPAILKTASARLGEVARFAEVYSSHGIAQTPLEAVGVRVIPVSAAAIELDPRTVLLEKARLVSSLRKEGKTWRQAAEAAGLNPSQARYAVRQAKRGRSS